MVTDQIKQYQAQKERKEDQTEFSIDNTNHDNEYQDKINLLVLAMEGKQKQNHQL